MSKDELGKEKYTLKYTFLNLGKMPKIKKKYSIGFYTGGVDVSKWSELSKQEKDIALKKHWYLRWSFRNPDTGKLERQNNHKGGVNLLKTKTERVELLKAWKKNLTELLDMGYSPFDESIEDFFSKINSENSKKYSIKEALFFALEIKKLYIGTQGYRDYESHVKKFLRFLGEENYHKDISNVTRKVVLVFLKEELKNVSPRTRNNILTSLKAIFTTLKDEMIIDYNFVSDIPKIKTKEKTDRTFSRKQLKDITEYLKKNDPYLLFYIKFVSYNFLREIETNRIILRNINLDEGLIYFYPKNKATKIKRIPSILLDELRSLNLESYNQDYFLFTPNNCPGEWDSKDEDRRQHFTGRFNKVKKKFGLGKEYGISSYRHSSITNMFQHFRTVKGLNFHQAAQELMPITGHTTISGLINYLHKIDADIPPDWSEMVEIIL